MKKVLLMGLSDTENIGDQFVPKCVQYIVESDKTLEWKNQLVNLTPAPHCFSFLIYCALKILARLLPNGDLSYHIVYIANHIREWRYYKRNLKSADAIIFSLGSYKYTTQDLWAYYALVIQIAEKMQIPVMFDAMNIQDYNEDDWRCRILKKYTNYSCVKVFTTRDGILGINELKNNYITNPNIKISAVGDAAYWIPECYNSSKKSGSVIGINLIRGNIFIDYGKTVTKKELLNFYAELIYKLDEHHIKWELFTNGGHKDLEFGHELLKKINRKNINIRVPKSDSELPHIISSYKGIIGARLHACICAYSLDVPLVGFIWDKKMLRFAQVANLENYFLNEDELNPDRVIECLENATSSTYNTQIRTSLKDATKQSIYQFLNSI